MKFFVKSVILGVIGCVFLVMPMSTVAHELLPQPLTKYLTDNPNATSEEIKKFIAENNVGTNNTVVATQNSRQGAVSLIENLKNFLLLGIQHVLSGLDHVLFVVLTILAAKSVRTLLTYVTAFTLAHSITLIAAALGAITLPATIVEPVIALTIVYLAAQLLIPVTYRQRLHLPHGPGIIFVFGLFHGLGFASALGDLGLAGVDLVLALLSFNVGIEIAQLLIIMAAAPFVYLLRPYALYRPLVWLTAAFCGLLAIGWTFERLFNLSIF